MARRFEDDVSVTAFEVNTDEWLKEVQVRSGQNSNCPCDFCSLENDDKLGRVRRLVFDRFFDRRYGKVGVCGICFKRWYSVALQPRVFDENVFSKNCRMGLAVCPDNPCLDEHTLRVKRPYAMLSSRIYTCEGERAHLQKVEKRCMEQFGVPEGFNPSEDFESVNGEAWCQAVDAYMLWKYPGSPDEAYDPETKDLQDEAERQTKEDAEMAERCGVEPKTETVGESQEEAEPPKKKRPRILRIRKLDNDSPAKTEKRCSPRKKVMKYILENCVSSNIFGFC